MYSFSFVLSSSYTNLGSLLSSVGASPVVNPESMAQGFFRNRDSTDSIYIASGYNTAPTSSIGLVSPGAVLLFDEDFNANLCWVKSSANTPILDFVVGSGGYPATNPSGVAIVVGTPTAGQIAQWTSASGIQGVATSTLPYARPLFEFHTNQTSLIAGSNLYSGTVAANTLISNGDLIKARFSFVTAANAHSRFTNINWNGTNIISAEITANAQWGYFDIEFIRTGSTTARASGFLSITGGGSGEGEVLTGIISDLSGLDFTAISHLTMHCQSDANADLTAKMADAQYIPAP